MYSTSTAVTNNNESNSSYMPVGINENVILKSVEAKKSPNGHDFLEIIFEDSEGKNEIIDPKNYDRMEERKEHVG